MPLTTIRSEPGTASEAPITPATRELAKFVVECRADDVAAPVRHEALRSLINWVGCAIGGAHHQTVEIALQALRALGGAGDAVLLGRRERLAASDAALINGMSSAVLDFDSTQAKFTNIHPSGPVLPAILAVAGLRNVHGRDLLHAYILGVEIACRLANDLFRTNNPGWHVTGVCGGIGAAAAAGRLLGLDQDRMIAAFGIAATQAGGLREMYGTMCKSFTPGRAAQNGLLAAMLAARGFSSAEQAIEGEAGFGRVFVGRHPTDSVLAGLGVEYEVMANTYKPFACAIVAHAAIDGCIRLKARHRFSTEDIEQVSLTVSPMTVKLAGEAAPRTGLEAKFSAHHTVALALLNGKVSYHDFVDAAVQEPAIVALRGRVSLRADPALAKDQATVHLHLRNGSTLVESVDHALGGLQNPMKDADIERKFMDLTAGTLSANQPEKLLESCWRIAELDDVRMLLTAAVPLPDVRG